MSFPQECIKAEATGNDFIMFADLAGEYEPSAREVMRWCNRHFGIGADGVIRVTKPEFVRDINGDLRDECAHKGAQLFMDYRNADGSIAEMCGNGTRATAQLIATQHLLASFGQSYGEGDTLALGTRAGVKTITMMNDTALGGQVFRVNMGAWKMGSENEYTVTLPGTPGQARGTFVDMGNPHVVAVLEDAYSSLPVVDDLDLSQAPVVSPTLENGQNVEFVRIDEIDEANDLGEATMRVFERGCGETLSCGTGICATAVVLRARTGINHWRVSIRGGVVRVDVNDNDLLLTGPAHLVASVQAL